MALLGVSEAMNYAVQPEEDLPESSLTANKPAIAFNRQCLGQLKDLWWSVTALVENGQNSPFLSNVNRTNQNMQKTSEYPTP